MVTEYNTIEEIVGPLVFLDDVDHATVEELVEVELPSGEQRRGKVLEVNRNRVLIQLFEGTRGVDITRTKVRFLGRSLELSVSPDILGRIFNGLGMPIDDVPAIIPEKKLDIKLGETTPDGRITLKLEEECLAACTGGPMMTVNGHYKENLTPEKVDEILDALE